MAKDILSQYGRDSGAGQRARATCGGDMTGRVKELPYSTPVGPKGQMDKGVSSGTNHGNKVMQGRH